jgi:hypothetical protein
MRLIELFRLRWKQHMKPHTREKNTRDSVLPDDLDQLPLKKVRFTVILTAVNGAEVCIRV